MSVAGPVAEPVGSGEALYGLMEPVRRTVHTLATGARRLATAREHRRFRWLLAVGLVVRFVLAPLTSWGIDTPNFVLSVVSLLNTGSPYSFNVFFNPPLGPAVELPLLWLLSLVEPARSFVVAAPGLVPAAVRTQMLVPYLPTPSALLLLKTPLILCDGAVGLLLYGAVLGSRGPAAANGVAAAWLLNPLVIWASAVHGEVDTLATFFTLASLLALERRWAFPAGIFLGLGAFAKIYPLFLAPLAFAFLLGRAGEGSTWGERLRRPARFVAGLAASVVPFLPFLPGFSVILAHQAGNVNYGGVSLLIVFNPNITSIGRFLPPGTGLLLAKLYVTSLGVAVAGSVLFVLLRRRQPAEARVPLEPWLAVLATWIIAASLLAVLSTQAENLVGVLPFLLLAVPLGRRRSWGLFGLLSAAGFAGYLSLLTPFAYFYPLATLLGPGAVGFVNHVAIGYTLSHGLATQGTFWVLIGVIGGSALVATWLVGGWTLLRTTPVRRRTLPTEAPE